MRVQVLAGALLALLFGAGAASAEAAGQIAAEPGGVPTVTIINKAPAEVEADAPNALSIVNETEAEGTLPGRVREVVSEPEVEAPPGADDASPSEAVLDGDGEADTAQAPAPAPPPPPTLHIDVDLTNQTLTVSEGGAVRHSWPISSGRRGYATPTGTFQPTWMARQWFSKQYDNAPMPHSIFFHEGVAIHGSWALRSLGRPASHGCVRLAPKNASTLFRMVSRHGKDRTRIVVHGTPNFGPPPAVASREQQMVRGSQARRNGGGAYTYLPPSAAAGRNAGAYNGYTPPRARRRGQAQAYYPRPPRGLFTGYGF
ncbi:L,D-transpeptidase [Hyphomicrobium sp.]|uniref:L,D-transpeptidase n=1 Tax=Hyphomicrobium sp. TaxID=82 RepID=UPI002C395C6D|nr:L,D-transpeptidase [Hyphomicrobium sp.]HRN87577.1 L,D-transpeptidase [Hyphomicrobium sp.]HRQ26525.1 L,D-transpeptidase [Hyphomicrobium sp.]